MKEIIPYDRRIVIIERKLPKVVEVFGIKIVVQPDGKAVIPGLKDTNEK